MKFEEWAQNQGLFIGQPMKTEPKYSHPATQAAWMAWKYKESEQKHDAECKNT